MANCTYVIYSRNVELDEHPAFSGEQKCYESIRECVAEIRRLAKRYKLPLDAFTVGQWREEVEDYETDWVYAGGKPATEYAGVR